MNIAFDVVWLDILDEKRDDDMTVGLVPFVPIPKITLRSNSGRALAVVRKTYLSLDAEWADVDASADITYR